jgi:hypothetical protein
MDEIKLRNLGNNLFALKFALPIHEAAILMLDNILFVAAFGSCVNFIVLASTMTSNLRFVTIHKNIEVADFVV